LLLLLFLRHCVLYIYQTAHHHELNRSTPILTYLITYLQRTDFDFILLLLHYNHNYNTSKTTTNSINITDDSSGERGNLKLVIATMSGTPCTVLSNKQIPAVDVNSSMVAAYNYVPGLYPEATAVSEESLS
jgi:hypothetical protein